MMRLIEKRVRRLINSQLEDVEKPALEHVRKPAFEAKFSDFVRGDGKIFREYQDIS